MKRRSEMKEGKKTKRNNLEKKDTANIKIERKKKQQQRKQPNANERGNMQARNCFGPNKAKRS